MLALIEAALKLAGVIADQYHLDSLRKYIDKGEQLKLDIIDERNKGDLADQAKLSQMYKESDLNAEAMLQDMVLGVQAQK